MKRVYIETLGCQMNKSDSERIFGMLSHFGYEKTTDESEADLLIVNTCSIRQLSEDKAFSLLGVWGKRKKSKPYIKIGICGCVAQKESKLILKRAPYIDLVFGTHNLYELPDLIKQVENDEKVVAIRDIPYPDKSDDYRINREKSLNAWIPIMEGCNNFCTYCIVPYTRGRERSREMASIIKEAEIAVKQGFKEITLLGQNVDSYGKNLDDENATLANLLRAINKIDGEFRIRFVTSYPTDITDDLILAVKECEKVCEYFHIPMQSGNSEVLKKMNRRYNREQYGEIVGRIRNTFEHVAITSDFIAGFPGETEDQFLDTLSAIEEFELDYSNTAAYSPRPKTVAAKWTDKFLSEDVKKERLARLNAKNQEACFKSNEKCIGKVFDVLVESAKQEDGNTILTGRARNNKLIHFAGSKNLVGKFVNIKITKALQWCLKGEIVD